MWWFINLSLVKQTIEPRTSNYLIFFFSFSSFLSSSSTHWLFFFFLISGPFLSSSFLFFFWTKILPPFLFLPKPPFFFFFLSSFPGRSFYFFFSSYSFLSFLLPSFLFTLSSCCTPTFKRVRSTYGHVVATNTHPSLFLVPLINGCGGLIRWWWLLNWVCGGCLWVVMMLCLTDWVVMMVRLGLWRLVMGLMVVVWQRWRREMVLGSTGGCGGEERWVCVWLAGGGHEGEQIRGRRGRDGHCQSLSIGSVVVVFWFKA